ncbi:translocation and assembly module lipoprotein TamL [Crocinitomix algicola]|uniref:translocation and assembly module lipoprotein TamL n=1 Tax=Crocinitomix algicola TaxID=1740263 RepID=UPI00082F7985|nr:BamA/TamA family outer membrane protein [Crocinitomix algicola]
MRRPVHILLLFALSFLALFGCRQAKYVENGKYLLKSNEVRFKAIKKDKVVYNSDHPFISSGELTELIRPVPNRSVKLFFYNRIDTVKYNEQVDRKEAKFKKKNLKRQKREERINLKRIKKAEENGDSLYRHKVIPPKPVKLGWRDWVRTNLGQAPVTLDTFRVSKSRQQIEIYLKKKGFFNAQVSDSIIYHEKKRKASTLFTVKPGKPYRIRSIKFDSIPQNKVIYAKYKEMKKNYGKIIEAGDLLDENLLDQERERLSQYCRDEAAMLGFNKNYIGYAVDTTVGNMLADVTIYVKPKFVKDPTDPDKERMVEIDHLVYRVKDVTFHLHNPNQKSFKDYAAFVNRCDSLGMSIYDAKGRYVLLDTITIKGKGTFIFNEIPFVNPDLLDRQNFLEIDQAAKGGETKYYKEYYVERSARTMSNLGVFENASPKVQVDPKDPLGRWVVVDYHLTPLDKSSFLLEPGVYNTNGILGINGIASYTNRNLLRGAQELAISFTGGMESQPLIVGGAEGGEQRAWELNTFEWGPKISLTFPKIVPVPRALGDGISKRAYPKTVFDLNVNYQKRTEFKRTLTEFAYFWKFQVGKTQNVAFNWLKFSYVNLEKEASFQQDLINLNDPFLLNSYSDHLAIITSATWHYNNNLTVDNTTTKNLHDLTFTGSMSGKALTPVIYDGLASANSSVTDVNENGLKEMFGVPYTEFWKIEGQYIANQYINPKHRMAYRAIAGIGIASGNSPSLPYEQAFFAGGSNDIRAFSARTMAPGSYKAYADSNATLTQIGDMKLEANVEWRFEMTELLEGALFVDAGNIWNLRRDTISADAPSVFKPTFYKEIAIGTGFGIRADFDFLIVRLDLSFALHNPHLPEGERWAFTDKTVYKSYFQDPDSGELINYERPHWPRINFGIGYPF